MPSLVSVKLTAHDRMASRAWKNIMNMNKRSGKRVNLFASTNSVMLHRGPVICKRLLLLHNDDYVFKTNKQNIIIYWFNIKRK